MVLLLILIKAVNNMAAVHRQTDLRSCGHTTRVIGQDFVKIGGQLVAVVGDSIIGGTGGDLISTSGSHVKINNKTVIVIGDSASPDSSCDAFNPAHCTPNPAQGSDFVNIN